MTKLDSEADVDRRLPLIELAKHYDIQGLTLFGSTLCKGICPFCKKPEFQIMSVHAMWLCFACSRTGTTIDLVTEIEGISKQEAIELINSWIYGESVVGSLVCR